MLQRVYFHNLLFLRYKLFIQIKFKLKKKNVSKYKYLFIISTKANKISLPSFIYAAELF